MGYLKNTAEGGTHGANVSVANSGDASGDPFDTIVINNAAANGGGTAFVYDTTSALQGTVGIRLTPAASTSYLRWTDSTPGARGGLRRPFKYTGTPSAQIDLASIRSKGGGVLGETAGAAMLSMVVTTSGRVAIAPAGTNDAASLFLLTVGNTYWFEMFAEKGTTTTDGKAWLRVYAEDGTTVLWDYSNNACNTRSSDAWQFRLGGMTSATGYTRDDLDGLQAGALSSGFFGPLANAVPTFNSISATQNVAAGASVSVTASATDPDGTVASYAWTVDYCSTTAPTLSGASTATATFTAPAAGNLVVLKCTATDNLGATSSATTEVRVPSSGALTVLPDDAGKGYTVSTPYATFGTVANASLALADASTSTGIESAEVGPTPQISRFRLAPATARDNAKITLTGVAKTDSAAVTASVALFQGAVQRQIWALTPTTTPTAVELSLDSGTLSAITDWGDLWLQFSAED